MTILRSSLVALAGVASVLAPFTATGAEAPVSKKKIIFIAGKPSHGKGEHEHRAGSMLLAGQLNKSGLPVEATVISNGWPEDPSVLKDAAAIVIYADGGGGHPAAQHLDELKAFAKAGVGIGCMHYGVEVEKGPVGDAFLDVLGGYFEANWSVNPTWTATYKLPRNPITRGVRDFAINDEWYYHMRFRPEMQGVIPVLTALPTAASLSRPDGAHEGNPEVRAAVLERKEPQHMMWAYQHPASTGTARAFGFTGGHYHKNWQNDDFRRIVLNAVVWISGLDVPEKGVPTTTPTDEEMKANLDPKG